MKVYSAVFDWRNSERDAIDFTTGAYIDAYDGNVNTLKNMWAEHPNKYHLMMADIYAKVKCVPDSFYNSQYLLDFGQLGWPNCNSNCKHSY
jgi:hypothetical protein